MKLSQLKLNTYGEYRLLWNSIKELKIREKLVAEKWEYEEKKLEQEILKKETIKKALISRLEQQKKEAELKQQKNWRQNHQCEICGKKLGMIDKMFGNVRCKEHR